MSKPIFDIAFYGIIQSGMDKEAVIRNMAGLFKSTPEKIRPFFSGGRKVIKSRVDELTADKYKAALEKAGLVIKLEAQSSADIDTANISVAPVGADVLENPPVVEPQPIGDISDITMAEAGADVPDDGDGRDGGVHQVAQVNREPEVGHGVPADQPPTGLPGVRPGG